MSNKELTIKELKEKINNGDTRYYLPLAHLYRRRKNYLSAYKCYIKVIGQGHPYCARFICEMIGDGNLDKYLSKEEQFNWLLRFHDTYGVDYYTSVLAYWYKDGIGVQKDLKKYVYYLTECADDGSCCCLRELAECYEKGIGVEQSYEKAYDLYSHYYDEHGKPDITCLYKEAYYMYHELGGAKKDMELIKRLLIRSGRFNKEARDFYKDIFNEDFPEDD